MENKNEWYRKLLRKLNNIKAGNLDLDEYIDEVKAKIEARDQALSMSGVVERSEQLKAFQHFAEFAKEEYGLHIPLNLMKEYVKSL